MEHTCPMCGYPNVPMGELGPVSWYRCRACGIDYSNEEYAGDDARLAAAYEFGDYPWDAQSDHQGEDDDD